MGLFLGRREPLSAPVSAPASPWAAARACGELGDSGCLGSRWVSCSCPQTLLPGNPPPASWESCGKLCGGAGSGTLPPHCLGGDAGREGHCFPTWDGGSWVRLQGGSEARVVPWPPAKELEARKCLGEGKNFASEQLLGGEEEPGGIGSPGELGMPW